MAVALNISASLGPNSLEVAFMTRGTARFLKWCAGVASAVVAAWLISILVKSNDAPPKPIDCDSIASSAQAAATLTDGERAESDASGAKDGRADGARLALSCIELSSDAPIVFPEARPEQPVVRTLENCRAFGLALGRWDERARRYRQSYARARSEAFQAHQVAPVIESATCETIMMDEHRVWAYVQDVHVRAASLEHEEVLVCGYHTQMSGNNGPIIAGEVLRLSRDAHDPCLWTTGSRRVRIDINRQQGGEAVVILGGGQVVDPNALFHKLTRWPAAGAVPATWPYRYQTVVGEYLVFDQRGCLK